ncbi:MAG TPA: 2-oxoacid:acceptor oxidoreductase subunit alpha [Dehalococcoidia bacterium]|nr:2-oxoacid:acceptor oxidoreductase subunit alpha [Dehalococcoidia bacterium]
MRDSLTIGIVGAGGDGVVVLGSLLQRLAAWQGYFSQMPRYYGAQIRGGGSAVKLGLDGRCLSLPEDSLDILVCFNWEKYLEFEHELELKGESLVLFENNPSTEFNLPETSYQVDFSKRSHEVTGSTIDKNIVALGVLLRILALDEDQVKIAIDEDEELKLLKQNIPALEAGGQLFTDFSFPELRLSPARDNSTKLIMHGNAAMARAAIRAGCRVFFGYPITPAAEIMNEMQLELSLGKGVFLQAEDEIASSGMALGASLTGAKAMTATSGPGFDLMTEMLGLATAAEIPLVIIDVQRCGPSTGIPSRSEQSDLNHAIYGGHGDAPRVVIAPYDMEGCYRLAIESINIAQQFQTPVILLSDQYLGQTFISTSDEFLRKYYPAESAKRATNTLDEYYRYRLTEDSISPMADVGSEGLAYQTTGLAHNEKGEPSFDFETNQIMHLKRWSKLIPLCHRDELVKVLGKEESSRGVITWGSSAQVVLETVKDLGLQDTIKICIPELIHPLPERVKGFIKSTEKMLVIEMNYSGQLHRYLRSQLDLPKSTEIYARAGGQTFRRKELAGPITELTR